MIISKDELASAIPSNNAFDFDKIIAYQQDAEQVLKETIGDDFFQEIQDYVDADKTPIDTDIDNVINYCIPIIMNLSFYFGFDVLNTEISNTGFHRRETENSLSLYQRQEENLRRHFLLTGYKKIDLLLEFLDKNKSIYTSWADSNSYIEHSSTFIKTAKEFSKYIDIKNSRYTFMKLKPAIVRACDFDVQNLLGVEYYNEILTEFQEGTLTVANEKIVELIKKAIPFLSIKNAGINLLISLTDKGLFHETEKAIEKNYKEKSIPDVEMFLSYVNQNSKTGNSYLKTIESYLKANIDAYPTYENSDAYNETGSVYELNPETEKIHIL